MNRALGAGQWLLRGALALLFAYAAVPKLVDPAAFAQAIDNYRFVPVSLLGALALVLPVLELVTAAALLTKVYFRGAAVLSALMLAAFAGAMAQAKLRGIDLDCGCLGSAAQSQVSWAKVALNAGLAILSAWLVRWPLLQPSPVGSQAPS